MGVDIILRINKHFSSLRWRIATYLMVIGIGFLIVNLSIMEILEQHLLESKKVAYQKYSIQLAQIIAKWLLRTGPEYFLSNPGIWRRNLIRLRSPHGFFSLNSRGIVERDFLSEHQPAVEI